MHAAHEERKAGTFLKTNKVNSAQILKKKKLTWQITEKTIKKRIQRTYLYAKYLSFGRNLRVNYATLISLRQDYEQRGKRSAET